MILLERTRNSSGGVRASRRPARQSATSGWLLTWSGIVYDEAADGVDGHPEHAVHEGGVQVMDLTRAQLVDAEQDHPRPELAERADDHDRRRLHVVGDHSRARPHQELRLERFPARHPGGYEVGVEGVHRADDP